MYSCCFIGHRDCPNKIKNSLLETLENLIVNKNVKTFYVGTQGKFDQLVYTVLCELEEKYQIQTVVVLAYLSRSVTTEYYDNKKTIFPDELTKTPLRFAIRRRNTVMINNSQYVVTYLNTPFTNTYTNIEEAIKKKKHIINLGEFNIENIKI